MPWSRSATVAEQPRLKDQIGKRVRLLHDIHLRGGRVIVKGTIMRIYSTWRGRWALENLSGATDGVNFCRCISQHNVEILED